MDEFDFTEAHEASGNAPEALERFEAQVKLYRAGLETMGVVEMYCQAALDFGATQGQVQAAWDRNPRGGA